MSSQNRLAQPGTEVVLLQHQRWLDSAESSVRLDGTVAVQNSSLETSAPPATQLDIGEPNEPEDHVYPTGPKVYLAVGALYTAFFLNGLDLTIVAVAVPTLTNYFHSIDDIGWYSAAYGLASSSTTFFFGKVCTVFSPKSVVLAGLTVFVSGSLLCTLAQSSKMFIIGRAICGLGVSAIDNSTIALITHLFPVHKRSSWLAWSGTAQSIGLSCAPVLGGALIDRFSWRACFGINLPLCPLLILFTIFFLEDPIANPNYALPLEKKLRMVDLPGTLIVVPSVTCLLIALQFGGIRFGWGNGRIIALFVVFAGLALGFAYLQHRLGDKASIPARIIKKRSILAACWFSACCNGILAMTEYYISVYWQGVRNETALKSGLLTLGLIIGLFAGSMLSGFGIPKVGYFTPFMLATSLMAPIASGLLTTISLDDGRAGVVALLAFLGFAVGIGINGPIQAASTLLAANEVSIGAAIIFFGGGLGSPLFISASAALFQNRLTGELPQRVTGINTTALEHAGLSDIRNLVGKDKLREVLMGYNYAVVQTLYMPLALALLTLLGSLPMEWPSVKKKRQ